MDMIDILGSLLGQKTSRGGKGGDALNDIFGRASQDSQAGSGPRDIAKEAKDLEDMLIAANDRQSDSTHGGGSVPQPASPRSGSVPSARQSPDSEQQALILIRAMINAAKADGRLDQNEQEKILKHLKNPTAENVQFIREEFQRPLDARGFALSVPVGMEQQVYTMSLIAIDLDTGEEAKYLMELANNLQIPTEVREQIHQKLGAPSMY